MKYIIVLLLISLFYSGCKDLKNYKITEEKNVKKIPIQSLSDNPKVEISSLTIHKNHLYLIPQYPGNYGKNGKGIFYRIPIARVIDYIEKRNRVVINPEEVEVDFTGFEDIINKTGNGFEAVCFAKNSVYAVIEVTNNLKTSGLLIKGKVYNNKTIKFQQDRFLKIPTEKNMNNYGFESISVLNGNLFLWEELNGVFVNTTPKFILADTNLINYNKYDFVNIEYRLTDATLFSKDSSLYIVNYFYPGDKDYKVAEDKITQIFGQGLSHSNSQTVERLLKLKFNRNGKFTVDGEPIFLKLNGEISRNWEGIAIYKDYLFLATDMYPETIVGYIKLKPE